MFRLLPEFLKGTHMGFPQVKMGTCKTMSIRANRPLYIHADGEVFTSFGSNLKGIHFDMISNGLQVVKNQS
jgi:diacylglycerol kinase family enzyme